ncbi:OsmC family peroxiredoxin [Pontibacter sp. HSC-14F20]|uniref:OsmC family peroxiredoxin n=1 Tax=unclassified Pontibacter TaxID=2648980 RepID=UPI001C739864|nr:MULTISPECIES: OsmC family peroxiredoxin [unclassified Pontibacter]MBX0334595.1 OsmC family peroxiredoxin [Pontibacter sp. HSC-14F20]MCP2042244.1 osmotically inducible protein OsmC [Pontibacter sp. HSC-36F09]
MKKSTAKAQWNKGLKNGNGEVESGTGNFKAGYTFASRFENDASATNPEELIGAAHAGCYSMFLSALLEKANYEPESVRTTATVHLGEKDGGPHVMKIELNTEASVAGISDDEFQKLAEESKAKCPISKALGAVPEITLTASLKK